MSATLKPTTTNPQNPFMPQTTPTPSVNRVGTPESTLTPTPRPTTPISTPRPSPSPAPLPMEGYPMGLYEQGPVFTYKQVEQPARYGLYEQGPPIEYVITGYPYPEPTTSYGGKGVVTTVSEVILGSGPSMTYSPTGLSEIVPTHRYVSETPTTTTGLSPQSIAFVNTMNALIAGEKPNQPATSSTSQTFLSSQRRLVNPLFPGQQDLTPNLLRQEVKNIGADVLAYNKFTLGMGDLAQRLQTEAEKPNQSHYKVVGNVILANIEEFSATILNPTVPFQQAQPYYVSAPTSSYINTLKNPQDYAKILYNIQEKTNLSTYLLPSAFVGELVPIALTGGIAGEIGVPVVSASLATKGALIGAGISTGISEGLNKLITGNWLSPQQLKQPILQGELFGGYGSIAFAGAEGALATVAPNVAKAVGSFGGRFVTGGLTNVAIGAVQGQTSPEQVAENFAIGGSTVAVLGFGGKLFEAYVRPSLPNVLGGATPATLSEPTTGKVGVEVPTYLTTKPVFDNQALRIVADVTENPAPIGTLEAEYVARSGGLTSEEALAQGVKVLSPEWITRAHEEDVAIQQAGFKIASSIEVKPSPIHGYGVFATSDIAKGEVISEEVLGKIGSRGFNWVSEKPNVLVMPDIGAVTIKGIVPGEELTVSKYDIGGISTVHSTPNVGDFNLVKGGLTLLTGRPEIASPTRAELELAHYYEAPSNVPNVITGYGGYIGVGKAESESIVKVSAERPGLIVRQDVIISPEFAPREGESQEAFIQRTSKLSGMTGIAQENYLGFSTERQVITPTSYVRSGEQLPGSILESYGKVGSIQVREPPTGELFGKPLADIPFLRSMLTSYKVVDVYSGKVLPVSGVDIATPDSLKAYTGGESERVNLISPSRIVSSTEISLPGIISSQKSLASYIIDVDSMVSSLGKGLSYPSVSPSSKPSTSSFTSLISSTPSIPSFSISYPRPSPSYSISTISSGPSYRSSFLSSVTSGLKSLSSLSDYISTPSYPSPYKPTTPPPPSPPSFSAIPIMWNPEKRKRKRLKSTIKSLLWEWRFENPYRDIRALTIGMVGGLTQPKRRGKVRTKEVKGITAILAEEQRQARQLTKRFKSQSKKR